MWPAFTYGLESSGYRHDGWLVGGDSMPTDAREELDRIKDQLRRPSPSPSPSPSTSATLAPPRARDADALFCPMCDKLRLVEGFSREMILKERNGEFYRCLRHSVPEARKFLKRFPTAWKKRVEHFRRLKPVPRAPPRTPPRPGRPSSSSSHASPTHRRVVAANDDDEEEEDEYDDEKQRLRRLEQAQQRAEAEKNKCA